MPPEGAKELENLQADARAFRQLVWALAARRADASVATISVVLRRQGRDDVRWAATSINGARHLADEFQLVEAFEQRGADLRSFADKDQNLSVSQPFRERLDIPARSFHTVTWWPASF